MRLNQLGIVSGTSLALAGSLAAAQTLHFTYLWHMEQPIYWPDQQPIGADRYETAWTSIQRTDAGATNPENNLRDIFGKDDRVAAYQYRVKDSIQTISGYPEAGAQVSYSGGLIENVRSLGDAFQLGYGSSWYSDYRTARNWATTGGQPRLDVVVFPFHHPLSPLIDESTLRKQIQLYKAAYPGAWGTTPGVSRGFFPSEMAFSTRMIQVLAEEGIDWSFVSAEKISRACADFPVQYGSGGVNCDPPNKADQINPAQGTYERIGISRGCGPAEAVPFAFTPHRAQHVDPNTGQIHEIVVVPCGQAISWEDGFNPLSVQRLNDLAAHPGERPMLVTLAHDGDNAWGGGFSYYMDAVQQTVGAAASNGHVASTVEQYLQDHPVPSNAVIHVEDGAWVNADGDFGSPQYWNWNYPPVNGSGQVDIENGWAEDIRNWAVITAAQNHVDTAEQIWTDAGGTVDINEILDPDSGTNAAERAWHYFNGALNSGYMYYGTALDFEVKPSIACNEALEHANTVIGNAALDATGPTVWIPQRWPWNPGETNFGSPYGYQQTVMPTDVTFWTFVDDVSGVQSVTLKYRVDADGTNPLNSTQNETYVGGAEVGAWQDLPMTARAFPAGNVLNDPGINFFEMPQDIADQYHVTLSGLADTLVDYYVEAVDTKGTITRSPIQHVWIGDGEGATGGGNEVVITPDPATAGEPVTVTYDPTGRVLDGAAQVNLHWGVDDFSTVFGDVAMSPVAGGYEVTITPPTSATQLDFVFNDGNGNWDNNAGQDWQFPLQGGEPVDTWTVDGFLDTDAIEVANRQTGLILYAGLKGDVLYLACTLNSQSGADDRFILLAGENGAGALGPAMWAKSGQVAAWDAFVGTEGTNGFAGWFDQGGAPTQAVRAAVLESTIDLAAFYGALPERVHVNVASYTTPDGGSLIPAFLLPANDGNGDITASEYLPIELCSLTGTCCPPDLTTEGTSNGQPDGAVTLSDFSYYLGLWATGETAADITTEGVCDFGAGGDGVTLSDFSCYLSAWATGCP
ncbi:MAG: GC-type dockerin domain-anchored protein [Planctomycetota bacterium]